MSEAQLILRGASLTHTIQHRKYKTQRSNTRNRPPRTIRFPRIVLKRNGETPEEGTPQAKLRERQEKVKNLKDRTETKGQQTEGKEQHRQKHGGRGFRTDILMAGLPPDYTFFHSYRQEGCQRHQTECRRRL